MKRYVITLFFFGLSSFAPFPYDLHLTSKEGNGCKAMIAAHGMGGDYTIADYVKVNETIVSFNFPDYDYGNRALKVEKTAFGTIDELLPLLYVIKETVIKEGYQAVDLYGFSAGGGALINAIGVLNTNRYDESLKKMGILQRDKERLLQAIQKGVIILDTPLKSIREIIDFRGWSEELEIIASRFQSNGLEPIDSLKYLEGLSLQVILHFQNPDEVLSNRDDDLFFTRLKKYNAKGSTKLIVGNDSGHLIPHPSLWAFYVAQKNKQQFEALKKWDLPLSQFAVTGSGPLGARNLREIADIDIIVNSELWDSLAKKYGITDEGGVKKIVFPDGVVEAFGEDSFNTKEKACDAPTIVERIVRAEMIPGLPFERLEHVLYYKRQMGRQKDLLDIQLIEECLRK